MGSPELTVAKENAGAERSIPVKRAHRSSLDRLPEAEPVERGDQSSSTGPPSTMTDSLVSPYFSIFALSVGREIPSKDAAFDFL